MARPVSFDRDRVLETIQDQFWSHGYSATSLDDIMRCTGLGKGSLYGTYGSKHGMYLMAFTEYCDRALNDYAQRLRGTDDGAIGRLRSLVEWAGKAPSGSRRGCMLARGTAELAGRFQDVDKVIKRTFKTMEDEIAKCVRQAQRAGDIAPESDAQTIAITLLAVIRGMEALKRAGTSSASLSLIARSALHVLQPANG